jgi:hypothetical protein
VSAVGEEVREGARVRVISDLEEEQGNGPLNAGFVEDMVEMAGLEFTVDSIEGRNIHFNGLWWSRNWFEVLAEAPAALPVITPEQFPAGTRIVNISGDRWSTREAVAVVEHVEYSPDGDSSSDRIHIVDGMWNYRTEVVLATSVAPRPPVVPQPILSTYERVQAEVDRVVGEAVGEVHSYRVRIPGTVTNASRRPGVPFTLPERMITPINERRSVEVQVTIVRNERHEVTV